MTTATITEPELELLGQTVVVIGATAGIGLETARRARAEGAEVITVAPDQLEPFFDELPGTIDHVIVAAGGSPFEPLADTDFARARAYLDEHLMLPLHVARIAAGKVRPGGTLLFVDGTGSRRPAAGLALRSAVTVGMPALVASLALELAPVRVNLIAADSRLGDDLRRAGGPADMAALAVHLMEHPVLTGATYDVDRGQQLLPRGAWR
jgi:NAD(P)-dependent dehydrogenase (short-subunit alcohol dehydrogenase family)